MCGEENLGHSQRTARLTGSLNLEMKGLETSHWYAPASFFVMGPMVSRLLFKVNVILSVVFSLSLLNVHHMEMPGFSDTQVRSTNWCSRTVLFLIWIWGFSNFSANK